MYDKCLKIWLPENLDIEIFQGNGERPARQAYVGHLLTTRTYDTRRSYVSLNTALLNNTVSSAARLGAFEALNGHVEIDHHYCPELSCKGYRWAEPNRKQVALKHELDCPRFSLRLQKIDDLIRNQYTPLEQNLDRCIRSIALPVDTPSLVCGLPLKPGVKCEVHRRNVIQASGERIQDGEFGIVKTSKTNGRVYSCVSNLSSNLRKHLTLDGHQVVEVDLASAQPYFLADLWGSKEMKDAVSKGEFYTRMNERSSKPWDLANAENYKRYKQVILSILYAKRQTSFRYWGKDDYNHKPIIDAMEQCYPGVTSYLNGYGQTYGDNALAIAMQQAESKVFIGNILTSLQNLDIPAVPIHDSIMCRKCDTHLLEEIMRKHLVAATGIDPVLKISGNSINTP